MPEALGSLTMTSDGRWEYTLDNDKAQYLDDGQVVTEVYTVETTDGTTHDITITINGAEDQSKIEVIERGGQDQPPGESDSDKGTVTEDGASDGIEATVETVSGTLTVTDADDRDSPAFKTTTVLSKVTDEKGDTYPVPGQPMPEALGSLTMTSDGRWEYTLDNDKAQYLDDGQVVTEVYTVKTTDGTTHDITIVINGKDDKSKIEVIERGGPGKPEGKSDSDRGEVTEDEDTNAKEDGIQLQQSGTLTVTDVDTGDTPAFDPDETEYKAAGSTNPTALGQLAIDASGAWSYEVSNDAVQYLDDGQVVTEVYTVKTTDGTTHDITIVINGKDDKSKIEVIERGGPGQPEGKSDSDRGEVTEDEDTNAKEDGIQLQQSGTLTVTDVDTGDTPAFDPDETEYKAAGSTNPTALGQLAIDASGAWSYEVSNDAVQYLDDGQVVTEVYTVKTTDGTTHDITIVINGKDDKSKIEVIERGGPGQPEGKSDSDRGEVTEDEDTNAKEDGIQLQQSGTLTVTDVDTGDTPAFDPDETEYKAAGSTNPTALGQLAIDASGVWSYEVSNDAVQYLDDGQVVTEVYTVKTTDGTTHDITIVINGKDDKSKIEVIERGGPGQPEGKSDSDRGEVTEDEDTNTKEDGIQLQQSGTLTVTDVDTGDTPAFDPDETEYKAAGSTNPTALGQLAIDASGVWSYEVSNDAVQYLDDGQVVTEVYTVKTTDGTTHDITIVINGKDDKSKIEVIERGGPGQPEGKSDSDRGEVTEDEDTNTKEDGIQLQQSGTLTVTDVDTGDTPAFDPDETEYKAAGSTNPTALGQLAIDASGAWSYEVSNAAVQYLDDGQVVTEVYTVKAADGTPHDVTITINGADDPSKIVLGEGDSDTGTVTEDGDTDGDEATAQVATGTLTVEDDDASDPTTFQTVTVLNKVTDENNTEYTGDTLPQALGTLTMTEQGTWTYTLNNTAAQYLDEGESVVEVYTVKAADGTPHDVTITINGTNDKPLSTSDRIRIDEHEVRTLGVADFGTYSDAENDALASVKITSLSDSGSLEYEGENGWEPVTAGQEISIEDLVAGKLRFIPNDPDDPTAHESGDQYATIKFEVSDGSDFSENDYELVIDVTPVADKPRLQLDASINNSGDGGLAVPPPPSTGLLFRTYEDLGNGGIDINLQMASQHEALIDNANPTTQEKKLDGFGGDDYASSTNIPLNDSCAVTGLIYLEAGNEYKFSGYHDDLLQLEIGGDVLFSSTGDSYSTYEGSVFTPASSGYYTLELYAHNAGTDGAFSLNVSVNDGAVEQVTGDNFHIYASVEDLVDAGGQFGAFVPGPETSDGGHFPIAVNTGAKDSYIEISNIAAMLVDDDTSEIISEIVLSGIPAGSRLWDGTNLSNISTQTSSVDISDWDLNNIRILPPPGFTGNITLTVSATSQEQANKDKATTVTDVTVTVFDPADSAVEPDILEIPDVPGNTAPRIESGNVSKILSESALSEGTDPESSLNPDPATSKKIAEGQLTYNDVEGDALNLFVGGVKIGALTGDDSVEIGSLRGDYGLITFYGDGSWSYQLDTPVNHQTDTTPFDQFEVKLNDGTFDSNAINIKLDIKDDGIQIKETSTAYLPNTSGHSFTGVLNTVGADIQYDADLSGNVTGWGTGDPAITHFDSTMTSGGLPLYYCVDPADTSVLIAYTDSSGSNPYSIDSNTQTKVFQLKADPNNDKYIVETSGSGAIIDATEITSLDGTTGGKKNYQVVVENDDGTLDVELANSKTEWEASSNSIDQALMALSGRNNSTGESLAVNWSKNTIGVASGWINGGDQVLVMDFVSRDVTGVSIGIDDKGSGYKWAAYGKDGELLNSGFGQGSAPLNINGEGVIYYIEISGKNVSSDFRIESSTLELTRLSEDQGADPINIKVEVSDQDGDTASTSIALNFTAYQIGEDNPDDPKDDLVGTAGSDYLAGGIGNDTLKGDPDGESSTDVFAFNISDLIDGQTVQTDTLLDFALGKPGPDAENGDILDISGLVDFGAGEALVPEILGQKGITASYDEASQTATITFITSNDESSTDTLNIVFSNTTGWSDLNDSGVIDSNDVLQQLINNGQLIV